MSYSRKPAKTIFAQNISFYLYPSHIHRLDQVSRARNLSRSAVLRAILDQWFAVFFAAPERDPRSRTAGRERADVDEAADPMVY